MREHTLAVGAGTRWEVRCRALPCGEDWVVAVTGGEAPHVGAVTLAWPSGENGELTVETRLLPGHRDDTVSDAWARELAGLLRCRVCVTAGLHVDRAAAEDIAALLANSETCLALLRETLSGK